MERLGPAWLLYFAAVPTSTLPARSSDVLTVHTAPVSAVDRSALIVAHRHSMPSLPSAAAVSWRLAAAQQVHF